MKNDLIIKQTKIFNMCGIFGFKGFKNKELLVKMADKLRHRGPDDDGFFEDEGKNFSMGMVRLSIIDLKEGSQPIFSEDKRYVLCFNGEIYNYIELRKELIAEGHIFSSQSDSEVIIHSYEQWGKGFLEKLNGMFAFCIYDKLKDEIFIARDRCGQKPFYYYFDKNKKILVFASEIKAILECKVVPKRVNFKQIDSYLSLRYVPEPETMFQDIFILPAGHYMFINKKNEKTITRYWDIKLEKSEHKNENEYLEELDELFNDSIKLTMRSDVPVGAYLSAGVDSSLITNAMVKSGAKVNTYSLGFGSEIDETHQAREFAKIINTNHTEIICSPKDFDKLPDVVYHMDRPVGDALIMAFYKLAQETSKDVKVVLSGEGADEMFAGYSFHKILLLLNKYKKFIPELIHNKISMNLLKVFPVELLNIFFKFPAFLGKYGKERLIDFLKDYYKRDIFSNSLGLRLLMSEGEKNFLYQNDFAQQINNYQIDNISSNKAWNKKYWVPDKIDKSGTYLDGLLKLQYSEWLQDWAIIRQEKNTMAHSLEVRLPFLDHRIIEKVFLMPDNLKMSGFKDKIIERKLASLVLPPKASSDLAKRPKKPFFMPMEFFYDHKNITDLINDCLSERAIKERGYFNYKYINKLKKDMSNREFVPVKQIMSLVIFEIWHKVFNV